jgi:hypothetical protein
MTWHEIATDGQPPRGGKYIVFAPSSDSDMPLIAMARYEPPGPTRYRDSVNGWELLPREWLRGITHWMELPDPPGD